MHKLITVALLALLATTALATCPEDCTQFKMEEPPKPEDPGTNTGEVVSSILEGFFTAVRAKAFGGIANDFGYIAAGIFGGVWGSTHAQEQSKWQEYKLDKNFKQQQDYLAVSNAIYQIGQRMDADKINNFNNAINSVSSYMADNCEAHNCLNVSTVEPSQRNAATGRAGASCVAPHKPVTGSDCSNVTWDPKNPRLCRGADAFGTTYEGVCGTDGMCYHSSVGFAGTIAAYASLKDMFLKHPAINYFQAFDNLYSANAVVAYAKGALVYLSILQELYMLGSPSAEEGIIKAFAQRAAVWLQDRMDWHTNIDVCLHTVADASSLSSEPISIRASCRNEDVYDRVWGCSHIGGFSPTATMCVINPNVLGNSDRLCSMDCSTTKKQNLAPMNSGIYSLWSQQASIHDAANRLSEANKKIFNNAKVPQIVATLKGLSQAPSPMPVNSFMFYQKQFTPKLVCNKPRLLKSGAPSEVKPLGTWEEPDNLSKGSVVVQGVVIGGEGMQAVGNKSVVQEKGTAKAPAKAPAKAAQAPARRLLM